MIEAFKQAEAAGVTSNPTSNIALLHHYAAVAYARQGNEGKARRHWRTAVEFCPALDVAQKNLEDWKKPVGERHAPWALAFASLVLRTWLEEATADLGRQQDDDDGPTQAAQHLNSKGKLPPGPRRMWVGGQWRDVELMAYEIVTEPMGERTRR